MKKELKISTLSIVCVLCTVIAMPSFGASAVRSIGGAGTYSSASNAATAGSKTSSGSTNSVRAGSLRSTGAKATTSASSTRAAATPRLSIGKYLSGVGATGKPSTGSGSLDVEQSGWNDKLDKRVGVLELDVKKLKEDFNNMTGGGYEIAVEEKDGVLTISQGDKEVWSGNVGSAEGLEELQETLDEITARVSVNETAIADLESKVDAINLDGFLTSADLSELNSAVSALKLVDESMDAAIKVLQGGKVSTEDLNAKVEELKTVDAGLQVAINELKNSTPSTEGLVNKAYVDGIKSSLESADAALDAAIKAIEKPDVNKVYVDSAISNLNTAISNLQNADSVMDQTIAGLETLVANAATKDEIKDFITSGAVDSKIQEAVAGLATDDDIKDFVSSGKLQEEIAKLATKDSIANFVNSEQVAAAINDATKDLLTAADIADFVKSGDMTTAIADATKDLVTKTELDNAKSDLQAAIDNINAGQVELTNYYTKADADAKFATKTELTDMQGSIDANASDIAALETAVLSAVADATDAKLAAGSAQNMADLNAADIKELKDAGYITEGALTEYAKRTELSAVATSGSYNDLFDKPDLTQYVTETQVTQSVSTAINAYEIPNGSITAEKIQNGAVTSEKINTGTGNSGEMVMLMSNGDGTSSWVSVTVDAE